jgi:hypothetical protein
MGGCRRSRPSSYYSCSVPAPRCGSWAQVARGCGHGPVASLSAPSTTGNVCCVEAEARANRGPNPSADDEDVSLYTNMDVCGFFLHVLLMKNLHVEYFSIISRSFLSRFLLVHQLISFGLLTCCLALILCRTNKQTNKQT